MGNKFAMRKTLCAMPFKKEAFMPENLMEAFMRGGLALTVNWEMGL